MSKTRKIDGVHWFDIDGIWYPEVDYGGDMEKVKTNYGIGFRKKAKEVLEK